jgi:acetyl esterase
MSSNARYFESSADWERFTQTRPALQFKTNPPFADPPIDVPAGRASQIIEEAKWASDHPLESFGYTAQLHTVSAQDGHEIGIKVYHPLKKTGVPSEPLPLLFVTHGGGWVKGTYATEEAWLLYPLLQNFSFIVVSVDYRRAPEYTYPFYIEDSWDALQEVVRKRSAEFGIQRDRIFLAGSSAGALIAAVLAQKARDAKETARLVVEGVILNVPITCHPGHFPADKYEFTSYDQCGGALLSSGVMRQIWDISVPNSADWTSPRASPLLGDVSGLPAHLIFVAGQDPLRDEGIAYAQKLKGAAVDVEVHVYQGVPHVFAEFWELETTERFVRDLIDGVRRLLA